ncbi:MAG: formyltransferase family protein [Thiotrichaceae bacterium]
MKILFLGDENSSLVSYLEQMGENVLSMTEKVTIDFIDAYRPDFIISYGYRYIIKQEILDRYVDRAINLHISFLPWNRGADPNFWSFIENTPRGVTIHYLDSGIDTGDIIVQKQVEFSKYDTLRISYYKLHDEIRKLFVDNWTAICTGTCERKKQNDVYTAMLPHNYIDPSVSYHKLADKARLDFLLTHGWDTPVSILEEFAAESRISTQFFDGKN